MFEAISRKSKNRAAVALAVALSVAMLTACGGESGEKPSSPESTASAPSAGEEPQGPPLDVTVLFPVPGNVTYYPFFVATELGYFENENLNVMKTSVKGSGSVIQQILSGNGDVGIAGAANDIAAGVSSDDIRVFACWHERNNYDVATLPDSGIEKLADLKGKSLGVSSLTGGEIPVIDAWLRDAGLIPNEDVKLVPVGQASAALEAALTDGTVDAYSSGYNQMIVMKSMGLDLKDITPDGYANLPGSCFVALNSTLEDPDKREGAIRLARAWAQGAAFGVENETAAVDIVCDAEPATCTDRGLQDEIMERASQIGTSSDPDFPHGFLDLEGWQQYAEILLQSGLIDTAADVKSIMDTDEVRSMQAEINEWSRDAVKDDAKEY